MKSNMIVFGEDWGSHPSSTQHLIKHLSKNRKTLWVNSIGLRRPKLSLRDILRLYQKGLSILRPSKGGQNHKKDMNVLAPKVIPWPGNPIAKSINKKILGNQIREKTNEMEIAKPIVWTSLPTVVDVIDQIDHQALVYYCGDDFSALDGVDHKPVSECEIKLSEKADLIIAASDKLAEKFPIDKTVVLPHGVDFEMFSKPASCPEECQTQRPIAGFYGSVANWLDLELIAMAARELPDWDFMFVGDVKTDISVLDGLQNIRFIPPQPHELLPGFVQHWQAALLPFLDNEQIRACNPLKLREYLASGTPVITTEFPAMETYRDKVNVMKDADELVHYLENIEPRKGQRSMVQQESWEKKANHLDDLLSCWDA